MILLFFKYISLNTYQQVVLKDNQSVEEGQQIAEELLKKLEVEEADFLVGAYHDMLLKNK